MTKPAKKDVTKLPQWAQDELKRLAGSVEHWKQKAHEATGQTPTDTYLVAHDLDIGDGRGHGRPLPRGSAIRFLIGGSKRYAVVHIDVRIEAGELYLNASDQIAIAPRAGNSVYVRPLEPRD